MLILRIDETGESRVRDVADAGLERQQVLRHTACLDLAIQEVDEVARHLLRDVVHRCQRTNLIGDVRRNDVLDFRRIARDERRADASVGPNHRDRETIRRIQRNVDIVHSLKSQRLGGIDLNDDNIRSLDIGRSITDGSRRNDVALFRDRGGLDDGNVNLVALHEAIAGHLRRGAQIEIAVRNLARVDCLLYVLVRLVRHTEINALNRCQFAVKLRAYRSAGPKIDFERCLLHALSQSVRYSLRITGRRKAARTDAHSRLDKLGGLFGRYDLILQSLVPNAIKNVVLSNH